MSLPQGSAGAGLQDRHSLWRVSGEPAAELDDEKILPFFSLSCSFNVIQTALRIISRFRKHEI